MALDPVTELERLVRVFDEDRVDYALCGGLALAVYGHPRATRDVDFLVRPEDLDRAIVAAKRAGFDVPARRMTLGLRTGTPREMKRVSKLDPDNGELISLDLIIINPELEPVWSDRVRAQWREQSIVVVSRTGLATMKKIAGRAQDLADLAKLEGSDDEDET